MPNIWRWRGVILPVVLLLPLFPCVHRQTLIIKNMHPYYFQNCNFFFTKILYTKKGVLFISQIFKL